MINFNQINQIAEEQFGELTDDQKSAVRNYIYNSLSEKELFEKLGTDQEKYSFFLKSLAELEEVKKIKEESVFAQEVSDDDLPF